MLMLHVMCGKQDILNRYLPLLIITGLLVIDYWWDKEVKEVDYFLQK